MQKQKVITVKDYLRKGLHVGEILTEYSNDLRKSGSILESLSASKIIEYNSIYADTKLKANLHAAAEQIFNFVVALNPDILISMNGREKDVISFLTKLSKRIITTYNNVAEETGNPDAIPDLNDFVKSIDRIQDILAFRIVFSGADEDILIQRIYNTANQLIQFMISIGFVPEFASKNYDENATNGVSGVLPEYAKFYKDYIAFPKENGYKSLHIYFSDPKTGKSFELQLRTIMMDFYAEYGSSNHESYKEDEYTITDYVPDDVYFAKKRIKVANSLNLENINIPGFVAINTKQGVRVKDNVGFITPRILFNRNYVI